MIISVANQKGGVGKTTTTQALFSGLVLKGYKVLAIDLDPQSNLSIALGAVTDETVNTIFEVMDNVCPIIEAIQKIDGGSVIPSNILLSGAEREFINKMRREELLRTQLLNISKDFDFILIDTPPSLGILTINAFCASDKIIIPMGADFFSLQGLSQLGDTVAAVKEHFNSLTIEGILLTRYNNRTLLSQELTDVINGAAINLKTKVFKTRIRSSISIQEAQTQSENLLAYANTNAQLDYREFVEELIEGFAK